MSRKYYIIYFFLTLFIFQKTLFCCEDTFKNESKSSDKMTLEAMASFKSGTIEEAFLVVEAYAKNLAKGEDREFNSKSINQFLNNGRLDMRILFDSAWKSQLNIKNLPKNPDTVFYHVCDTKEASRILEHGIYHDLAPTLTPYLPSALIYALYKNWLVIDSSILRVKIPHNKIEFVHIDYMGPGYLPIARRKQSEVIPDKHIPSNLLKIFLCILAERDLYWVDPKYIEPFHNVTQADYARIRKKIRRLNP